MGKTRLLITSSFIFWCLQVASSASAELAIVVHANSYHASLEQKLVANIFLGRQQKLPDGTTVVPLDQFPGNTSRDEFYSKVANKSPTQVNSYWSRLIFTGKGRPPFAVSDDKEVLELVSSNPNMIGYVDLSSIVNSAFANQVKVVLTVE